MNEMTWEQMLVAIKSLCWGVNLRMREPGNWYVADALMEHAHGSHCLVGNYGNGRTPEEAVRDHWKQYSDGRPFKLNDDQWMRWNGFMFEKSERPK